MFKRFLLFIFDIKFYLFNGNCSNCIYYEKCKNIDIPPCSFMDDNEYPNLYAINKECKEYKLARYKYIKKLHKKKPQLN